MNIDDILIYVSFRHNKLKDLQYYINKYDIEYEYIDHANNRLYLTIENSIKYNVLLTGDFSIYNDMISNLEPNHTENSYSKLIKEFDLNILEKNPSY